MPHFKVIISTLIAIYILIYIDKDTGSLYIYIYIYIFIYLFIYFQDCIEVIDDQIPATIPLKGQISYIGRK